MVKSSKKNKLTLTVTPEEREYLKVLAKEKGFSISRLVGEYAVTEYKRLQRKERKKERKRLQEEKQGEKN